MLSLVRSKKWPEEFDEYGDRVVAAVGPDSSMLLYVRYGKNPPAYVRGRGRTCSAATSCAREFGGPFRGRPSIIMSSYNQNTGGPFEKVRYGNYELVGALRTAASRTTTRTTADTFYGPGNRPRANWHRSPCSATAPLRRGVVDPVQLR